MAKEKINRFWLEYWNGSLYKTLIRNKVGYNPSQWIFKLRWDQQYIIDISKNQRKMKVPFFLQISGYYSQLYSNARISQCYCWKIATANGSALVYLIITMRLIRLKKQNWYNMLQRICDRTRDSHVFWSWLASSWNVLPTLKRCRSNAKTYNSIWKCKF